MKLLKQFIRLKILLSLLISIKPLFNDPEEIYHGYIILTNVNPNDKLARKIRLANDEIIITDNYENVISRKYNNAIRVFFFLSEESVKLKLEYRNLFIEVKVVNTLIPRNLDEVFKFSVRFKKDTTIYSLSFKKPTEKPPKQTTTPTKISTTPIKLSSASKITTECSHIKLISYDNQITLVIRAESNRLITIKMPKIENGDNSTPPLNFAPNHELSFELPELAVENETIAPIQFKYIQAQIIVKFLDITGNSKLRNRPVWARNSVI
jgi:hypothetical protein